MSEKHPSPVRFLVDADLPRCVLEAIRQKGYDALDVRDTPLGAATDDRIAAFARKEGLCLVTGDFDFAGVRNYPPADYAGLIVLSLPKNATARTIRRLVVSLLARPNILARVPGKLAIVEFGRVRFRPA